MLRDLGFRDLSASTYTSSLKVQTLIFGCKCGNCRIELLHNAKECQCCVEIDECAQCLQSETVIQEAEVAPSCITKHRGFDSLCLDKWSLRFAATNLRTREKQEYRQTGTEDR